MGGRIVLQLAMEKPERLRAVIGLQSGLGARLSISDVVDKTEYLNRPDVNAGDATASLCHSLLAPDSPSEERWETMWHYMQSGSGVFAGDVDYYLFKGDLRNGRFRVGPDPCPMYLLTGEYDWSASPETTQEILALNPRAKF
jgi:pimeloyl-ACP methyl ester carboxylesterase